MFRFLILSILVLVPAIERGYAQATNDPIPPQSVRLDIFVRSDRDSYKTVEQYVSNLKKRIKGLDIRTYDVLEDTAQLRRLYALSKSMGREKPVLPAFYSCNRMYFGFTSDQKSGPEIEKLFTADLYTRSTCSRCKKLKAFLPKLQKQWPAIRFVNHDVDRSSNARQTWQSLCRSAGSVPGLPTISFGRRLIIGYDGDESTGMQLEQLIRELSNAKMDTPLGANTRPHPNPHLGNVQNRLASIPAVAIPPMFFVQAPEDTLASDDDVPPLDLLELPEEATESETGEVEAATESQTTDIIDVPFLGEISASELGMPVFTLAIGLVDGFNPCAMWVLVFLLSVLVNIKDRRKILLIAGTFVFVSGAAYFAFMAAWLNIFMLIGIARPVQIALGVLAILIGLINVKDFFAFKKGISLSIPESQKPGLYRRVREITTTKYLSVAIGGAIVLAVVVNTIELLCTAGLPALYTQVLTLQEYPAWKNYFYLALYIGAYMFDDAILVAIVVATLSHRKLQEREGRWLKLISGLVILVLGLVMLLRPAWLTLGP